MSGNLLIGACGAGTVLNLPDYLRVLRSTGLEIRVMLTATAAAILPARTFTLVCKDVIDSTDPDVHFRTGHVELARWADHIFVLPATAHVLGVVAAGQAPSLLTATLLAHDRPVTFFPSMNAAMLANRAVRRNVSTLRADGHLVVDPVVGPTYEIASGAYGNAPTIPAPDRVREYAARIFGTATMVGVSCDG